MTKERSETSGQPSMSTNNGDNLQPKEGSVQFMLAEFSRIQAGEIHNRSSGDSRVNLYITLLSLIGGGIIALRQTTNFQDPHAMQLFSGISAFALLFSSVFGLVTFRLLLERWRLTVIYLRKLARIRRWFLARDPSLSEGLVYPTDETYPPYVSKRLLSSSLTLLVSLLNCLSISGSVVFLSALILPSTSILLSGIIGILVACIVWFAQRSYAMRVLRGFERDKYAQAPFGKNPNI